MSRAPFARAARLLRLASLLAVAACGLATEGLAQISFYQGIQYQYKAPDDPTYSETTFDIYYPPGGCLALPGCSHAPMPVVVMLHGGNTNTPYTGSEQISPIAVKLLNKGFVVVVPNVHVIDFSVSESWNNATRDAGRVIQFVRFFSSILNVDPNRLFCQGHSAGASHALFLALNIDYQDLNSTDPVLWQSSRPNFVVPWSTATNFLCFDPNSPLGMPSWTSSFFFGIDNFVIVPTAKKIASSPTTWLLNPATYGRTFTPPMGMVFKLEDQNPCGQVVDPHDGKFGPVLNSALQRYCQLFNDPAVCSSSALLTASGDFDAFTTAIVAWMAATAGL